MTHPREQILDEYNERVGKLSVVLFEDCLEHVTRAHRVLRTDRGHLMLVGVGGSGKKSICRLAAFAAGLYNLWLQSCLN